MYNHFSMRNAALSVFLLLLAIFCAPCLGKEYTVSKVIDGDSIVLETGEQVRYLGIDAPELGKSKAEVLSFMPKRRRHSINSWCSLRR